MQTDLLQIKNLVKHYPSVKAVNGINLTLPTGICFGLLGPNGAGKTTSIEMVEGIIPATSGEILYKGKPLGDQFQKEAGIMFQSTALQDYITVRETLEMFAKFYPQQADIDKLIKRCNLTEYIDQDNRQLSGGQRQRLLLAIALVNDPDIIFLDEPTTGLDPQARRNFWDLINGGGRVSMFHPSQSRLKTIMLNDLLSVYPQLKDIQAEVAWGGYMGYARHKMPQIGQLKPGEWYCQGFGGHGMVSTTMGGELIADAISAKDSLYQLFAPFGLNYVGKPFGPMITQIAYWSYQMQDAMKSALLNRSPS